MTGDSNLRNNPELCITDFIEVERFTQSGTIDTSGSGTSNLVKCLLASLERATVNSTTSSVADPLAQLITNSTWAHALTTTNATRAAGTAILSSLELIIDRVSANATSDAVITSSTSSSSSALTNATNLAMRPI